MSIEKQFRDLICLNEGGNSVAHQFSDPDGIRSGKSGWSFGVSQFDTQNNSAALSCLRDCGFTDAEIKGIVNQTIDVKPLAKRLHDHADIIEQYDIQQLQHCLNSARAFVAKYAIPVADDAALLALADTVNQYGSLGSGSGSRLHGLGRAVTAQDVLDMKLTWKYATASKRGHDDTVRRFNNIAKVVKAA
jgi:hypothetical protein